MRRFFGPRTTSDSHGVPEVTEPLRGFEAPPAQRTTARAGTWSASSQANIERTITNASRSFGEGVQSIVTTAKAKGGAEWKTKLLVLLGQDDAANKSDIDVLIQHSNADKFTSICSEYELAPNLVHCLRLLRVLELQHAQEGNNTSPVSIVGTSKVNRLLTKLCTDPSAGDQLRPHLFGLLALSGASYPLTGVHVAAAAGDVIANLAKYCLNPSLVWFIHDRKMIIHMTDDVKELAGMSSTTASSNNPVPMGLMGPDAERAGLLTIALQTVVRIVYHSSKYTVDVVNDFQAAGGYEVLVYAILHSTGSKNAKGLMELLPLLACCPDKGPVLVDSDVEIDTTLKLASNVRIFDIMADLLTRSNPILRKLRRQEADKTLDLAHPGNLQELAAQSVELAGTVRLQPPAVDPELDLQFDLSAELLAATMQLFAEHPSNYETVEERLHILTFSLLAFPCFGDMDVKNLVLKTLELVLTAVGTGDELTPVNACIEIFFAICSLLLKGDADDQVVEFIAADADLMGRMLEKLLEFDQRVAPLFVESGLWTAHLENVLEIASARQSPLPPVQTPQDKTFSIICRVLQLLVAHQPVNFSRESNDSLDVKERTSVHTLLRIAVMCMGVSAAVEASGVFEAYMSAFSSAKGLDNDMIFALDMLGDLSRLIRENSRNASLLERAAVLVSMLRSVLEEKRLSRNSFRSCRGFDAMLRIIVSMKNVAADFEGYPGLAEAALDLLQNAMGLLDAAIGMKARNLLTANEVSPLAITADVVVDCMSSQLSSQSTSSLNRNFIRQTGFYLNLAAAIAGTGILGTDRAESVVDLALGHMDPELMVVKRANDVQTIRNPDAVRLALGLALFMPNAKSGNPLATQIVDKILRLSEHDRIATSLPPLASCGLCYSLTNPKEFGPVLFEDDHSLQSRLSLLLSRVAAFGMSYMDFVCILRNIAGPVLNVEGSDKGIVRLPVISSSVKTRAIVGLTAVEDMTEDFQRREKESTRRLECICDIARHADKFARVRVGGDSINTIAVLKHEVGLDERLRATAEEGRLTYLEIDSVDASALNADAIHDPSTPAVVEKLWAPLSGSGFTYSLWLRHGLQLGSGTGGNLHILDLFHFPSAVPPTSGPESSSFLSIWYDVQNQRFNVMSSVSHRGEPTCFPVSPLRPDVWHHVLLTYTPAKRSVIARKSVFSIYVDGRPLEAEVRVESVSLPPKSKLVIGAPNPALAMSGVVRGTLPVWEIGPTLMLSTVLLELDATAVYAYGPGFPGLLWGDRPQRLSLAATATSLFCMLSHAGEGVSIASALRRRDVWRLEEAGYSSMGHANKDDLSAMNLLCNIPPECVVFGFQASTHNNRMRNEAVKKESRLESQRLVNLARLNYGNESVSTDAVVYGQGTLVAPTSFADCLRWVGGPQVLMPLVNTACSTKTLALALQIIRHGCLSHRPNLEHMQAGGGYRVLSVLLQGKGVVNEACLDQCLAFAIHGFDPDAESSLSSDGTNISSMMPEHWVFADLDAMKHLLLNHQVWDLRKYGPRIPLRILSFLNLLVDHKAAHKAFNARRLHRVGIIRWALHLAVEAAELYTAGDAIDRGQMSDESHSLVSNPWFGDSPRVSEVSVGGDPGHPFLLECKNLLRRVLTFMLTPGDLEELVECIVFTGSIGGGHAKLGKEIQIRPDDRMLAGPTLRLHLVRLLEELMVDGVNEIVAVVRSETGVQQDVIPHAGGVASPNQPYFTTSSTRGKTQDGGFHPKHQQAQNFLSAFASFLTPVWFATVLEGCQEEASASALLRLMILMIQASSTFEEAFRDNGAFAAFVLSIPRYSTCPGIAMAMLSQLLNVPILHLHSLPTLNSDQLCEVFDSEGFDAEYCLDSGPSDPSSGIFALLAECMGRNVQLVLGKGGLAPKAAATNQAIVKLLAHRHATSLTFRAYSRTPTFVEPLGQALCLVYNEQLQPMRPLSRSKRPSVLSEVPNDLSPTERFIGSIDDPDSTGMGFVRLIRMIITDAMNAGPLAAKVVYAIFRSFPIHASPQQVAAFHLVLIEHCCAVIDGVLHGREADAIVIANCIGICSVFLDHEVGAFFTSEAALKSVKTAVAILNALLRFDTPAVYSLSNSDHSMLTRDAAYIANLACIAALKISLPYNANDRGDEDLQANILQLMVTNIVSLLLLPSRDRRSNWKVPSGKAVKPAHNSKAYEVWQSASVVRCVTDHPIFFPDYFALSNPDVIATAPLLVSLNKVLHGSREDVKALAMSILEALLQRRSILMSELLVMEVKRNGRTETIDLVNRGGFKALSAAHEAAAVGDGSSPTVNVQKKYSSFYEWLGKNDGDVQLVFTAIEKKSNEVFPRLQETSISQEETVESEQKLMLMRLSTLLADRMMIGGFERAELARLCSDNTIEIHSQWKRQGFDDLAYGAMKWKFLLRQLKGATSIWEGGPRIDGVAKLSLPTLLDSIESGTHELEGVAETPELVTRWKLDLTEGHERQRRRLLPNYEFHGLYNLDEEQEDATQSMNGTDIAPDVAADFLVASGQMEATAALLKDLNIKRSIRHDREEDYDETEDHLMSDVATEATTASASTQDQMSLGTQDEKDPDHGNGALHEGEIPEEKDSSSYELITGLLQAGDWPEKSYNVRRCTGLEVTKAIFLWCGNAIYVIDGFEQTGGDGIEGKISRVERERSSFHINLRPKDFKVKNEDQADTAFGSSNGKAGNGAPSKRGFSRGWQQQEESPSEVIYEHRSQRILLTELYSVYRRRYQLQQTGLEFYDVHRNSALIAFATHHDREEILFRVLQSNIPNSIFGSSYGTFINYTKFMKNRKSRITSQWQAGKMTNFEFLMELNSLAGRSFNDLTQYPVFPWIIADYESEELDLSDPKTYRDLSKPMGAIGPERAKQFQERYEALASTYFGEDDPPPFHYGTHYSCAAYVLYYLMRLEPFSRLALALQGGRFDVADRLFHDVGRSWYSASTENLQDVRELIPEFFYLPDFLVNTNHFDFGETQRGKAVHDVSLPQWAKGDPKRFIRINRQALESEYVSKNLHHWVDLVFGCKQRGEPAVKALNTFVHVTYEGEVDIDAMTDPIQRQSTIAQIQNFGQTPSRLERTPFPQRTTAPIVKENAIDFSVLASFTSSTPPLCIVGAPHRVHMKHVQTDACRLGLAGQSDKAVGDVCYAKGQTMGVGRMCALIIPLKKYYRFGGLNNGVTVHAAAITSRYREVNRLLTVHDDLHRAPISAAKASLNGNWLVTGSVDSTLRVWSYDGSQLGLRATLCGHDGSHITSIDVSTECGVIASGCGLGKVLLWDLRTLTFVRPLRHGKTDGSPTISVSINHWNGNVVTLVGTLLTVFDINGNLVAQHDFPALNPPKCATSTDCPEWMADGIAVVSGHENGEVRLWSLSYDDRKVVLRHVVEMSPHSSPITALRVMGVERQDTLLIGDSSGRISVYKTEQLDSYGSDELEKLVEELSRKGFLAK